MPLTDQVTGRSQTPQGTAEASLLEERQSEVDIMTFDFVFE